MNRRLIASLVLAASVASWGSPLEAKANEINEGTVAENGIEKVEGEIPLQDLIGDTEEGGVTEEVKPDITESVEEENLVEEIQPEVENEGPKENEKHEETQPNENKVDKPALSQEEIKAEKINKVKSQKPIKPNKREIANKNSKIWEDGDPTIKSEELQLYVNEAGDIGLYDKEGGHLLYGHTNQEALKINGTVYYMFRHRENEEGGYEVGYEENKVIDNTVISTITIDGIKVTRTLSLVKGAGSSKVDTLKFSYEFENVSEEEKTLDFKLILDTMVEDNDHAPFSTPNLGQFSKGKNVVGSGIPSYWFAYDSLVAPSMVTKANLIGNMPDAVTFGSWPSMIGYDLQEDWKMLADEEEENGDSAVAMTWNSKKLKPTEKVNISTVYGVSSMATDGEDLVIGALDGEESVFEEIDAEKIETAVSLLNTTDKVIEDITVGVEIPKEFEEILEVQQIGRSKEVNVGNLNPGETLVAPIKLKINPISEDKVITYDVVAKSKGTEMSRVTRKVEVKNTVYAAEAKLKTPSNIEVRHDANGVYQNLDLEAVVKNIGTDERATIENMKVSVKVPEEYKGLVEVVDKATETVNVDKLEIGQEVAQKWALSFKKPMKSTEVPVQIVYSEGKLDKEVVLETKIKLVVSTPMTELVPSKPIVKPIVPPVKPPVKPTVPPVKPEKPETGDVGTLGFGVTGILSLAGVFKLRKIKKKD